jgi:hypothetical protein
MSQHHSIDRPFSISGADAKVLRDRLQFLQSRDLMVLLLAV